MSQITIDGINVKPTRNDSWKVGIKTKDKDGNEVWINGFVNNHPDWQIGQVVELDISQDPKWGTQFALPAGTADPKQLPKPAQPQYALSPDGKPATISCDIDLRLKNIENSLVLIKNILMGKEDAQAPKQPLEQQIDTSGEALAKKLGGTLVEGDEGYTNPDLIPFK